MPPIIRITTTSGAVHDIAAVFLCEESSVHAAAKQRSLAAAALAGTGLTAGVIGSPDWVLAGALALGALSALAANASARKAAEHLQEAAKLDLSARKEGQFVSIGAIDGVELPSPIAWRGAGPMSPKGNTRHYVHDGQPFLNVRSMQQDELWLSIEKIESYQYRPNNDCAA